MHRRFQRDIQTVCYSIMILRLGKTHSRDKLYSPFNKSSTRWFDHVSIFIECFFTRCTNSNNTSFLFFPRILFFCESFRLGFFFNRQKWNSRLATCPRYTHITKLYVGTQIMIDFRFTEFGLRCARSTHFNQSNLNAISVEEVQRPMRSWKFLLCIHSKFLACICTIQVSILNYVRAKYLQ